MSVEIHEAEIEALIQQRMSGGAFKTVEDVLIYALTAAPPVPAKAGANSSSLIKAFEQVRGLADDIDFSRAPSYLRSVELD